MGPVDALGRYARKALTFSGRASRSEFWWSALLATCVAIALSYAAYRLNPIRGTLFLNVDGKVHMSELPLDHPVLAWLLSALIWMAVAPLVASSWRRMHDTGRLGWVGFAPLVLAGAIGYWLLHRNLAAFVASPGGLNPLLAPALVALCGLLLSAWWLTRPSDPGHNRYGPNPLEVIP